jgi:hypothetical protein
MAILRCSECRRRTNDAGGRCEHCGRAIDDTFAWVAGRRSVAVPSHAAGDDAVGDQPGAIGAASSAMTPGDVQHATAAPHPRTRRRRAVLGGALLLTAVCLALGAWSTYRSPFITFGTERLSLADAALRDLEELSRQMGQAGAGAALNQLSGGIGERIRGRRRAVKLASAGALACAFFGLIALRAAPFDRAQRRSR